MFETPTIQLTGQDIVKVLAAALTLILMYFPGLRVSFAALKGSVKSAIIVGLLFLTTIIVVLLGCNGAVTVTGLQCGVSFWVIVWQVVQVFLSAVAVNQGAYLLFGEPQDVKNAKNGRYLENYGTATAKLQEG